MRLAVRDDAVFPYHGHRFYNGLVAVSKNPAYVSPLPIKVNPPKPAESLVADWEPNPVSNPESLADFAKRMGIKTRPINIDSMIDQIVNPPKEPVYNSDGREPFYFADMSWYKVGADRSFIKPGDIVKIGENLYRVGANTNDLERIDNEPRIERRPEL